MLRRACSRLLCWELGWRTTAIGPKSLQRQAEPGRRPTWRTRSARPTRSSDAPFARHVGLAESDQAVAADPAGQRARVGGSPWSAASGRRRRPPCRPDRPAASAAARRRGGADRSAIAPTRADRPRGTRATSGQRSESIAVGPISVISMVTAVDPFLLGGFRARHDGNAAQPQCDALHPDAAARPSAVPAARRAAAGPARRCLRAAGGRAWSRRTPAGCRGAARSVTSSSASGRGARTR